MVASPFDLERVYSKFPISYEDSLHTVLRLELTRFNRYDNFIKNFPHVAYYDMAMLGHVASFETHLGAVLEKYFYCSISFRNVLMG